MTSTMHDVARIAGVSVKTVSNVINDHPHVRPATRDRVLEAIEQLGYRPNLSARGLRSGKTGIIGLAVPELRENYFAELADAVIRVAGSRGLGVVVEQTGGDRDAELRSISGARLRFTDGILFSPLVTATELLEMRAGRSIPLVLLGEHDFDGRYDHVAIDNERAAYDATAHLVSLGRRRIAAIGAQPQEDYATPRKRTAG
ncbi:MAG: LacI family DNA-binding transcriptional regulator, partial [Microbacterium sp.]|nr:LacI family DNA-binding transcriptional regulator [Microbacterium sp.]